MESKDKIFNNSFESTEYEYISNFKFDLDPTWGDTRDEEQKIHDEAVARDIHQLIENSRFKKFNEIDEFGNHVKLKKVDINEVYGFIIDELIHMYTRIDLFNEVCVYFDANPTVFYASLSNIYKEELIEELDRKTGILKRRKINKLF